VGEGRRTSMPAVLKTSRIIPSVMAMMSSSSTKLNSMSIW